VFKILDDNCSGTLDIQEFWKGLCDFRLPISPEECRKVFDKFDTNDDGELSYNELIYAISRPLDPYRRDLVTRVFKKLDRDESGIIDIKDIESMYNAKQHPDVRCLKKTEQEVLAEFLDTFELHYSLVSEEKGTRDGKVNLKEFLEYYRNVGASIENDEYFELMLTNAWNLNDKTYSKGWGTQY
jgi:Ca2+-binding EF-hand superfamily protein